MRKCARAIIFDEQNRLLVFERERQPGFLHKIDHYYSIPGGGMDPGETPEQAVVRELQEEMLVDIAPERLLIHQVDEPSLRENFYFLARIISGTPTFNLESEEALYKSFLRKNTYKVAWAHPDDPLLAYHASYEQIGKELKKWLRDGQLPTEPVDMLVKSR